MNRGRERPECTDRSVGLTECGPNPAHCARGRRAPHTRSMTHTWSTVSTIDTEAPATPARRGRSRASATDGLRLVIVESPAQGEDDRRLPGRRVHRRVQRSATSATCRATPPTCPAKYKGESWARLGVNVDNGFEPLYVVSPDKQAAGHQAQGRCSRTPTSSTWPRTRTARARPSPGTCCETLKPQGPGPADGVPRDHPGGDPARPSTTRATSTPTWSTRRRPGASSTGCTATRSARCCGRRSCRGCRRAGCSPSPPGWWSSASGTGWRSGPRTTGTSTARSRSPRRTADGDPPTFTATLVSVDDSRVATGRDFDPATGRSPQRRACSWTRPAPAAWPPACRRRAFTVTRVEEKPYRRRPYAPFMTTTLQQEAGRKLRFSAQRTMRIAQRLYENGYITYMRTDSTNLSETALDRRPARRPASSTATSTCRPRRASTPARSRTRRRRTRPSGRRRHLPHPRRRSPTSCRATSSGSTS